MDKDVLKRIINLKVEEFNNLYTQVNKFKKHLIDFVKFPESGICRNEIHMNRLLKIRKDEIMSLASQL